MRQVSHVRVLLVTHYYADHRGGVEIVAAELAARLAERGAEVTWAASGPAPELPPGVVPLPMRASNVTEQMLGFPYPLYGPVSLLKLMRAVRRCDVVHLHDGLYLGNICAYLAARRFGKPVVVTQHIGEVPYQRRALRWLLRTANHTLGRTVLGGSEQVVFIAEKVRQYFGEFVRFRNPPNYLPNGVDRRVFHAVGPDQRQALRERIGCRAGRPAALFVGRYVEKKGLTVLRTLAGRFPNVDWLFAGWGPDDPAAWGLPNVRVLGTATHAELADYYRAADLLVLPSVGEGFPLVIQEAMACGMPAAVSTETIGGCPAVAPLVWHAEPTLDAWSVLVKNILSQPAELQSRRDVAAAFAAEHWDWDACAEQYHRLFRRLAGLPQLAVDSPASPQAQESKPMPVVVPVSDSWASTAVVGEPAP